MRHGKFFIMAAVAFAIATASAHAAPIMPDDPTISGNLQLWLQDAGNDFDGTTWQDSSGNNRDAVAVGTVDSITYQAGTASSVTPTSGAYAGAGTLQTVFFDGGTDDLMISAMLNGGSTTNTWTIFTVYQTNSDAASTRPAGVGSTSSDPTDGSEPKLNLAEDGSLRYDNGNNQLGSPGTPEVLYSRAVRLNSSDQVSQWFDGVQNFNNESTGGSFSGTPYTDDFYIGDVRAGTTEVNSSTDTADIEIAQVIVYNAALTDAQIDGVNEWLTDFPAGIPEPASAGLLGLAGLVLLRRRRRAA